MFDTNFKFSKNYTANDVKKKYDEYLKLEKLNINSSNKLNYLIKAFEDRMDNRYFCPAFGLIKGSDERRLEVSSILMGINCTLIESLYQFKEGLEETKQVRQMFIKVGKKYFGSGLSASIFYKNIRNGIVHQGQTKSNVALAILSDGDVYCKQQQYYFGTDIFHLFDAGNLLIEIHKDYQDYIQLIYTDVTLKQNFIKKIGFILNLR